MITITQAAIDMIDMILSEENNVELKLRMMVQGGGCSGFQYGFLIEEKKQDDDFEIPAGNRHILIDAISAQYLQGATVDYIDDLQCSGFAINNPTAETTCGCGSSFSV